MTRIFALLLFILFLAGQDAIAQAPKSVFIEELTWTELRDQISSGKTTIIIPIGGTEQNGPDMALGKHNVRVKALSEKIALTLGNALVAPVIAYVPEGSLNPPTAHMRFPGTITVPDDTFETVLEYAAKSFKLHGFQTIIFLGDHGGYQADLTVAANRLNQEWVKTMVRAYAVTEYYQAFQSGYVQALKNKGYSDADIGTHAGLADTSLMLAIDPRWVRMDQLSSGPTLTPVDGVYGNPRRSSAELGQMGVDLIVSQTVAAIRKDTAKS